MDGTFDRKIAQRTIGNKLLPVVFEAQREDGAFLIITAYYAKKEK